MSIFYKILRNIYMKLSGIYDWRLNREVDFAQWLSREDLNLTKEKGNQYQPSPFELDRLLKKVHMIRISQS
ncbi:MAG: hypothetical protein EOM34_10730 [Clostridia bacterium]|nr:hypothetical protein [Clostridia bacterium]NCD03031.1 hypothetical protein [Clostridia bacterium]